MTSIVFDNSQIFLFITLILWLFLISKYLDNKNNNVFILGLMLFIISFPLSINLAIITKEFAFGYVLIFLIPLLSLVFLVDSIFYRK